MRLLLLGGTAFVGRHVAEEAVAAGHEVTVFARGTRPPPTGVHALVCDRTEEGRAAGPGEGRWDAVLDTWPGAPRAVRASARLLADGVGHYTYVSSRSVHALPLASKADETAPVVAASADALEAGYPTNKRGGELAAQEVFGEAALFLRAGLILGRHENVGRLPWWLRRVARGGRVLAPGPAALPLQYIGARDLAGWALSAAGEGFGGPCNTVSPQGHCTIGELLTTCVEATGADVELVRLTPADIARSGLRPWGQLPIWLPPGELHERMHGADVTRASAAGLRCRPVAETVADTWDWLRRAPDGEPDHPRRVAGSHADEEASVFTCRQG